MKLVLHITNPLLRQYFIASSKQNQEGYVLSSSTATGMLVCALLNRSYVPQNESDANSVVVSVPLIDLNMPFRCTFISLTPKDELAVNMMLKREFNVAFKEFMNQGLQTGRKRKELIEIFIDKYNLRDVNTVFDTLAKKHYRARKYAMRLFL